MSLKEIKLDDRTFQQLVDEMRKRIPFYCPEWTDHNISDPGITLIELFAWMMETLLYRVNQVPELHYIRFLEMLGLHFEEPISAQGRVTFWLSEPLQSGTRTIDAGIEVSTTQTETEPPQVFIVHHPFTMHIPELATLFVQDRSGRTHATFNLQRVEEREMLQEEGVDVFGAAQEGDALYLGFTNDPSYHVIRLTLEVEDLRAAGGGRGIPPYVWQAYTGSGTDDGWELCTVRDEDDRTDHMNHTNYTQFPLPKLKATPLEGVERYWIRVQLQKPRYRISPRLFHITPAVVGCSVAVRHGQKVEKEHLGQCDGSPDQRFFLQHTPILAREPGEHLLVDDEKWQEVADFADSANAIPGRQPKKHYMLDSKTGELRFGPAIRQRDGSIKQYGQTPRRDANLVFSCYRYGGGSAGNLEAGQINTLKTSISFIKRVENLERLTDGADEESLEDLKMRATRLLRGSQRAVTADDFEHLAVDEYNRARGKALVARAKCIPADMVNPAQPGCVDLLIVPYVVTPATELSARLTANQLQDAFSDLLKNPAADELTSMGRQNQPTLLEFVKRHCLVTTKIQLRPVEYQWVAVYVTLRGRDQNERQRATLTQQILQRLYQLIDPINGGFEREGWEWGRSLTIQDIYTLLLSREDPIPPRLIREIALFRADLAGAATGERQEVIETSPPYGLMASGQHAVRFE